MEAVRTWKELKLGAEVSLAFILIGILFIILVPLPSILMDALLVVNVTVSLMVLVTAVNVSSPIHMSVFPSLLLVITFFRLALNIATTRLILGNGAEGPEAAGHVIQAFGNFVAGNHIFVGFTVFSIIMVVQFVVITKGSSRISEVAARFTLDAMPGKQMSIDSELASGYIDEESARQRRAEIGDEADFYGAMDGASKFVRGDAMAGIIIMFVNIIGGFLVGVLHHGMPLVDAAGIFTRLTIGDGLVTQIPALMVSVAAALLVTKNSGSKSLAGDLHRQIFHSERVFFVAAVFLIALLPSGLPKPVLLIGAFICGVLGYRLRGQDPESEEEFEAFEEFEEIEDEFEDSGSADDGHERARSLLPVEPLELEMGYRLVNLVDANSGGDLMARLAKVREKIALDLGLVLPPVKVRDNVRFRATEYSIKLRGNGMGLWRIWPSRFFVCAGQEPLEGLEGVEGKDPSTGEVGRWVEESQWSLVASAGYRVRRPEEIIPAHIDSIVRAHAAEILTREEVSRLLTDLSSRAPALVQELVPDTLRVGDVHKVLQNLLREGVSIRDLETILETLADHAEATREPEALTEYVRQAISRSICSALATPDGILPAAMLDPQLEELLQDSLLGRQEGVDRRLALEGAAVEAVVATVVDTLDRLNDGLEEDGAAILVCSSSLRPILWRLISMKRPAAAILAYDEISDDFRLDVRETVSSEPLNEGCNA